MILTRALIPASGQPFPVIHGSTLATFLQTPAAIDEGTMKWLTAFVGITAICFVILAVAALGLLIIALNLSKKVMAQVEDIKGKAMPLVEKSHLLMTDLTPQIKVITEKVREISVHAEVIAALAKTKAEEFSPAVTAAKETFMEANQTVRDANQKTQAQVVRVNGMVSSTLDAASKLGEKIHHGINVPVREVAGVASGIKAAVDTFMSGARSYGRGTRPAARTTYRTPDKTDVGI